MWIYEHESWPSFRWETGEIATKLAEIKYLQGRLLGRMESLGFDFKQEAKLNVLTDDVVKSSAIEGERLNPEEVRSSIARRLGLDIKTKRHSSRHVDGVVEMMLDATQNFSEPLTKERLFDWHASLFPTGRSGLHPITVGGWRTPETEPMRVVSGPMGRERVHFQAPAASRLDHEMGAFLNWFNESSGIDSLLKAGIAHLWFVTLHPFEDGNGRIGRAIADMVLARSDKTPDRFYSLSSQIELERKTYYHQLEKQQRSEPEITGWLEWFLECLERSLKNSDRILSGVLFKSRLWSEINQNPINERQRLVVSLMLEPDFEGFMNTSKYAKLAKCSNDTALRDIQALKARGILVQNSHGGRSTSYRLAGQGGE